MMVEPFVIAIDGPAASGKGTLAKRLASHFDFEYLDTGAIYRAVGWKILQQGGNPADTQLALNVAEGLEPKDLDKRNLYDEGVGGAASVVAAMPAVRGALFDFQRNFTKSSKGAVLDGRDIGTVICPDAPFKFFITAQIEARAKRRYKELLNKGFSVIYDAVLQDLQRRDQRDSNRDSAPLAIAHDAVCIDTTDMDADEVFAKALRVIEAGKSNQA